ncbi:MAG TPA: hypothetical protein VH439_05985 [Gemmatimonadales bacterium]
MTMPAAVGQTRDDNTSQTIKRRGLIAGAWAAVAGFVLRQTTQPVEAAGVVLGASNTAPLVTGIETTGVSGIGLAGRCVAHNGTGLQGSGSTVGVLGFNDGETGAGISGYTFDANSYGVLGTTFVTNGTGILGNANATVANGVVGSSSGGIGVFGRVPSTSVSNATGVYGLNYSTYGGPGPGAGGFGVYGLSAKGHGLVGAVATAGAAAVVGATNGVAGAYAGAFYGPVITGGDFTVFGAKSAAVPHPDGTRRRLYCMESPESWFEDFGRGQLACGRADVAIDPDFAAVVDLSDYLVFLTQYGGYEVLSVTEQTLRGFRVETQDVTSASRFGWRIVARRKDITAPRFEPVASPAPPMLPTVPDVPVPPPQSIPRAGMPRPHPK